MLPVSHDATKKNEIHLELIISPTCPSHRMAAQNASALETAHAGSAGIVDLGSKPTSMAEISEPALPRQQPTTEGIQDRQEPGPCAKSSHGRYSP